MHVILTLIDLNCSNRIYILIFIIFLILFVYSPRRGKRTIYSWHLGYFIYLTNIHKYYQHVRYTILSNLKILTHWVSYQCKSYCYYPHLCIERWTFYARSQSWTLGRGFKAIHMSLGVHANNQNMLPPDWLSILKCWFINFQNIFIKFISRLLTAIL